MITNYDLLTFGPVPSRRLGQSLGINNIPPKNCSYSCIYCQVGKNLYMKAEREAFYNAEKNGTQCRKKTFRCAKKRRTN